MLGAMARPRTQAPSPTFLIPALLRYLRQRGADPTLLCNRFGLEPAVEQADQAALTALDLDALMAAAAQLLGEPFLALRLPGELPLKRYGLAELAAHASSTLREALARLARYGALIHAELALVFEEDAQEGRFRQPTPGHPRGIGRCLHELTLALALTQCRRQSGRPLAALRVWFMHARPPQLAALERFFGTQALDFGSADNGLALPAAVLGAPTQSGDPRLLATVEELAEAALRAQPAPQDVAARVAARMGSLLPDRVNMEEVARALGMSPRTLQRRLEDSGTRFSDLLDDLRERLARTWVADRALPLAEVAYRLGFSDLATFSRAFKRWTGKPPGTWRRS